jgi:hypothetical protein
VGIIEGDGDGNVVGYADRAAFSQPAGPAGLGSFDAWLRTPIPVTKTPDPTSALVGYVFPVAGFVDLATYNSPQFDLEAFVAAAQAKSAQDSENFLKGREGATAGTGTGIAKARTESDDQTSGAPAVPNCTPVAYEGVALGCIRNENLERQPVAGQPVPVYDDAGTVVRYIPQPLWVTPPDDAPTA